MTKIDLAALPAQPAENQPLPAARPSIETLSLLAQRRSTPIALMTGPGPSRREIETLITLAARVPDHGKLGPWRFLVIEGAARERAGEKLAALVKQRTPNADEAQMKMERERLMRAPVVIAVISTAAPHPKIPEWEQVLSAGAASFQLVLAAHAMGYAGAWLTEWPAYDEQGRAALGLAPHERIAGLVYIGTAKADPQERVRPDVKTRIAWYD
jgi:nitroreductase